MSKLLRLRLKLKFKIRNTNKLLEGLEHLIEILKLNKYNDQAYTSIQ